MATVFEEVVVGWIGRGWNEKESLVLEREKWVLREIGGEGYTFPSKATRSSRPH